MISASFVSCLCEELNRELTGGRIDKIQQPAKDVLLLTVRSNGMNRRLLISASPGKARIHLTQTAYENPAEPPLFCILLRKHLTGALIEGFEQPGQDRLLVMNLVCFDDLGRETKERLITEMIPGRTNIVLVGEDGLIVDCAYRRDYEADMYRRLSPGVVYRLPPKPEGYTLPFYASGSGDDLDIFWDDYVEIALKPAEEFADPDSGRFAIDTARIRVARGTAGAAKKIVKSAAHVANKSGFIPTTK